jgi:tetrapyrrole methylase family protein / MazG family protein
MNNQTAAQEFKQLLEVSDTLLGPQGCPWDREQTLISMRESILEEACEVIEAIDEGNDINLIEELGDLLYNVVFFCKLGEKEGRFSTQETISRIYNKLILRHPHVFGEIKLADVDEVLAQWEQIKKQEKSDRKSLLDGIPKGLPALSRAYKIAGKMDRAEYDVEEDHKLFADEEELGQLLWELVRQARHRKINPETALRKEMLNQEQTFRQWENEKSTGS